MTAILLALVIITLYLYDFIKVYGIPPSISDTFYIETGLKFSITMISCAFLIAMGMCNLAPEWYMKLLSFSASVGLGYVGTAPYFKKYPKLHYIGAIVFMLSMVIWSVIYSSCWILVIWLMFPILDKERRVFWIEIYTILTFVIGIIFGSI